MGAKSSKPEQIFVEYDQKLLELKRLEADLDERDRQLHQQLNELERKERRLDEREQEITQLSNDFKLSKYMWNQEISLDNVKSCQKLNLYHYKTKGKVIKIIDGETLVLLLQVYDRVYETKCKMYGYDTKVLYQSKTDPDKKVQKQYDILLGLVNNCIVDVDCRTWKSNYLEVVLYVNGSNVNKHIKYWIDLNR